MVYYWTVSDTNNIRKDIQDYNTAAADMADDEWMKWHYEWHDVGPRAVDVRLSGSSAALNKRTYRRHGLAICWHSQGTGHNWLSPPHPLLIPPVSSTVRMYEIQQQVVRKPLACIQIHVTSHYIAFNLAGMFVSWHCAINNESLFDKLSTHASAVSI